MTTPLFVGEPRMQPPGITLDELGPVSLGEYLSTSAAEAFHEWPTRRALEIDQLARASGAPPPIDRALGALQVVAPGPIGAVAAGVLRGGKALAEQALGYERSFPEDEIPLEQAKAKIAEAGLEGAFKLPDRPSMRTAALDIMLERARARREREATLARGPSFYGVPTVGALATSFLVGAADPLNLASAFIPVVGEMRYAKLMASAGESVLARTGTRLGVGAAEGAVGLAALEPLQAFATLQEGRDYTMAHALHSVLFGAALGAGLRSGGGLVADALRARSDRLVYPFDVRDPLSVYPPYEPGPLAPRVGPVVAKGDSGPSFMRETPVLPEQFPAAPDRLPAAERIAVGADYAASLRSVGGYGEDEIAHLSALAAARYAARAERTGESAVELYRGEGIDVRGVGGVNVAEKYVITDPLGAKSDGETINVEVLRDREGRIDALLTDYGVTKVAPAYRNLSPEGAIAWTLGDHPSGTQADISKVRLATAGRGTAVVEGRSFEQSQPGAPPFFSAVARAVDELAQPRAPAAQWLATIKNRPGVKADELEWLGLEAWLKQQDGPVSKEAVQGFIRANQIEVRGVEKGLIEPSVRYTDENIVPIAPGSEPVARDGERFWYFRAPDNVYQILKAQYATEDLAKQHIIANKQPSAIDTTKFSTYVLPGGENYREMLLTLPELRESDLARQAELRAKPIDALTDTERQELSNIARGRGVAGERRMFTFTHFDEPNIVAHVRFNDRTIDGKRTLFIEEVQSDWHQKGRRQGYDDPALRAATEKKLDDAGYPISNEDARNAMQDGIISEAEYRTITNKYIPDAPFKTTWPELSLKRMIRYAAENGYEQIAWTPGKVQAERYDLSKQISRLQYHERTKTLVAYDLNKKKVIDRTISDPQRELPDLVGKDVAEKLMAHPDHDLSGLDLKVGGEGMVAFYDRELVNTANKLGKKYGARVGEGNVPVRTVPPYDEFVERHMRMYPGTDPQRLPEIYENMRTGEFAQNKVHALPITPALRDAAISQGFPLFQRSDAGAPRGRITLSSNRAVIELFATADRSTLLHEMGHLWLDELARDAAKANVPQALKDDLGTVLRWLGADKYADLTTAQHEQWARGFEQYLLEGKAPSNALEQAFEAFKQWLSEIYRSLRDLGTPITDDIRGVMDRMLASDRELAERLADLPARAQEDLMRGSIARLIDGEPVNAGELLNAAARVDPRIAESWEAPAGQQADAAAAWQALGRRGDESEVLGPPAEPASVQTGDIPPLTRETPDAAGAVAGDVADTAAVAGASRAAAGGAGRQGAEVGGELRADRAGDRAQDAQARLIAQSPAAKAAAAADARIAELYESAADAAALPAAERLVLQETLAKIDDDANAKAAVLREGAGCLAGGLGFAAAGAAKPAAKMKVSFTRNPEGVISGAELV